MKTEKEKMISGEFYNSLDEELVRLRTNVRNLTKEYNQSPSPQLLNKIFEQELDNVYIEPPFYCDYGINTIIEKNVYMNFNCIILDCAPIKIGENTKFGPNVQVYTATHPIDPIERTSGIEYAKAITIGKNCWIGGGSIILAGVTIGDNCTIGAGSVVTKTIPPNSIAVGNPCKVIKTI